MAKNNKADMSCARVKQYTAFDVSKAERHNERKNETYENMNVITERIALNVHFKKPTVPTYMEQLKQMETDGLVSLRGLRKDATLFNEIVIDVNTMYFERNGGYEYAKQFYEEAYHFIEEKFGADNVISAVMHADEINVAATEELGKEVYHYHLHAMVLPVVEKEILWSKRCKNPELRGTVKEVVNQISHSKKWKSDIPMTDEKGNPLLKKNGKPMFRASYSILQDELFNYMTERGFKGFQRGEYGSTAEHLTSLQYQIQQDKERLEKLQKRIQKEQVKYEPARHISKTLNEIDGMGQKTFTGKMAISKEDYSQLTALAKEGITSRAEINKLEQSANYYRQKYFDSANALERMKTKYNELKEKCRPFLEALEHFPEVAKLFTEKVKQLFSFNDKKTSLILSACGVIPVVWLALLTAPYVGGGIVEIIRGLTDAMGSPFAVTVCEDSVKTVLVFLAAYGMAIGIYFSTRRNYRRREEHGSAKWGNADALNKKYRDKDPSENKLLTQNVRIGLDGKKHRRNLNILVCGGSGAGKTRFFCKPNAMQCNTSFVVLDPNGKEALGYILQAVH